MINVDLGYAVPPEQYTSRGRPYTIAYVYDNDGSSYRVVGARYNVSVWINQRKKDCFVHYVIYKKLLGHTYLYKPFKVHVFPKTENSILTKISFRFSARYVMHQFKRPHILGARMPTELRVKRGYRLDICSSADLCEAKPKDFWTYRKPPRGFPKELAEFIAQVNRVEQFSMLR